jgi:ElaB/YqjD/DUF883 family membrane-anchored ribosome-binding protein
MVGASLCLAMTVALAQTGQTACGEKVEVKQGETLSDLAKRCGVAEARILDLNSNIEGSNDLRAGMTLNLAAPSAEEAADKAREAADSFLSRLKSYARETAQTIDRATKSARESVAEFIQRNPDLHHRIRRLGQDLNIPGMEQVEAQVSLSVRKGAPGTPVTLSAIGLPANQRVEIAGGAPARDYRIIERARTSAEGTLQATIQLPPWADPQRDFIFVIAIPDMNLAVRSARFDVLEQQAGR